MCLVWFRRSAAEEGGDVEMTLDEEDEAAVRQMIMQQRKQSVRRQAFLP